MAIFCALSVQPGINLPDTWREYENRCVTRHKFNLIALTDLTYCFSDVLFMRGFIMDRNFQAEHVKMRNPENDVPHSKGSGFMVSRVPYELHLQAAFEQWQVNTISEIFAGKSRCSERGQNAIVTVELIM